MNFYVLVFFVGRQQLDCFQQLEERCVNINLFKLLGYFYWSKYLNLLNWFEKYLGVFFLQTLLMIKLF